MWKKSCKSGRKDFFFFWGDLKDDTDFTNQYLASCSRYCGSPPGYSKRFIWDEKVWQPETNMRSFHCKTGTLPSSHRLPLLNSSLMDHNVYQTSDGGRILTRLYSHERPISSKTGRQPILGLWYYCGCKVPPSLCAGQKAWLQYLHNLQWQIVRSLVKASKLSAALLKVRKLIYDGR